MYDGLRGRNYLEMMNGTEYIVIDTDHEGHLYAPYSYEFVRCYDNFDLYRTKSGTSMVYFYDDTVSESVLENMDPISAEELMMERCFLEDGPSLSQFETMHEISDYSIVESSGITEIGDNTCPHQLFEGLIWGYYTATSIFVFKLFISGIDIRPNNNSIFI